MAEVPYVVHAEIVLTVPVVLKKIVAIKNESFRNLPVCEKFFDNFFVLKS